MNRQDRIIRNQIDFILVGLTLQKHIKYIQNIYPSVDVNSDHNPVVTDFKLKRFSTVRNTRMSRKINIEKLKNDNTKATQQA